jgi:hypothetical protein
MLLTPIAALWKESAGSKFAGSVPLMRSFNVPPCGGPVSTGGAMVGSMAMAGLVAVGFGVAVGSSREHATNQTRRLISPTVNIVLITVFISTPCS